MVNCFSRNKQTGKRHFFFCDCSVELKVFIGSRFYSRKKRCLLVTDVVMQSVTTEIPTCEKNLSTRGLAKIYLLILTAVDNT